MPSSTPLACSSFLVMNRCKGGASIFPCGKREYRGRELREGQSRSATKDEEFHRHVPGAMSRKVFSKCSSFSNPAGERSLQSRTGTPETPDAPNECRSGSCHGSSSRCSESISAL